MTITNGCDPEDFIPDVKALGCHDRRFVLAHLQTFHKWRAPATVSSGIRRFGAGDPYRAAYLSVTCIRAERTLVLRQRCFEELNLAFLWLGGWSAEARRPEMNKKYVVTLTDEERRSLRALVSSGKGAARKLTHARILLQADRAEGGVGWTDGGMYAH